MKFRDAVVRANPSLHYIPAGYKRYSHVMVLRAPVRLQPELGETILDLYNWCHSVYQHTTTSGQSRIPQLVLLAGEDDPEVIHKENHTRYAIDLNRITFSGGNRRLRERLVEQVNDGEHLLDMFAAVGNLSMQPLVHHDISAILVERNPYTFEYLRKTLKLNGLDPDIARNADCRSLEITNWADRIFLGYHDVNQSHLAVAIQAAREEVTLHLHPIISLGEKETVVNHYQQLLVNHNATVLSTTTHKVKDFAPNLEHYELIITIHT